MHAVYLILCAPSHIFTDAHRLNPSIFEDDDRDQFMRNFPRHINDMIMKYKEFITIYHLPDMYKISDVSSDYTGFNIIFPNLIEHDDTYFKLSKLYNYLYSLSDY